MVNTQTFVGEIAEKSGFVPIFSDGVKWICGECYGKVHKLALEIHEILQVDYLHFGSLLKER